MTGDRIESVGDVRPILKERWRRPCSCSAAGFERGPSVHGATMSDGCVLRYLAWPAPTCGGCGAEYVLDDRYTANSTP